MHIIERNHAWMTAHHCTCVSVTLHDAHAGHFFLDLLCNLVVYAQCICVVQAFLICFPFHCYICPLPHVASFSPGPSYPDCPPLILACFAFHYSLVSSMLPSTPFPFHPWLHRLTDGPLRNWIATYLYMWISICEWEEDMAWISLADLFTIHIQSGYYYLSMGRKVEQVRQELITQQLEN